MSGPSPITVAMARRSARHRYEQQRRRWAAKTALGDPAPDGVTWTLALRPPTQRQTLSDIPAAVGWRTEWAALPDVDGLVIDWEPRSWAAAGHQTVPVRVHFTTVDALARFGGCARDWSRILHAVGTVTKRWPSVEAATLDSYATALTSLAGALAELDDADLVRLVDVLDWAARHPESHWHLRQLPVRGVDTKWIERHRRLVNGLLPVVAARRELGYASPAGLIRIRLLDPSLASRTAGITELAVPADTLDGLDLPARSAIVVENLETFVSLPPTRAGIALWGSGYAVSRLSRIHWLADVDVVYWGDLDRDGFAILTIARAALPQTRSLMMDVPTLRAHRDLAVADAGSGRVPDPALLTGAERAALKLLHDEGDVRLEQERIPWDHVVTQLRAAGLAEDA